MAKLITHFLKSYLKRKPTNIPISERQYKMETSMFTKRGRFFALVLAAEQKMNHVCLLVLKGPSQNQGQIVLGRSCACSRKLIINCLTACEHTPEPTHSPIDFSGALCRYIGAPACTQLQEQGLKPQSYKLNNVDRTQGSFCASSNVSPCRSACRIEA